MSLEQKHSFFPPFTRLILVASAFRLKVKKKNTNKPPVKSSRVSYTTPRRIKSVGTTRAVVTESQVRAFLVELCCRIEGMKKKKKQQNKKRGSVETQDVNETGGLAFLGRAFSIRLAEDSSLRDVISSFYSS